MGDMADLAIENGLEDWAKNQEHYRELSQLADDVLIEWIVELLKEEYYQDNQFTEMAKSIIEQFEEKRYMSNKQREALETHYVMNYRDA